MLFLSALLPLIQVNAMPVSGDPICGREITEPLSA